MDFSCTQLRAALLSLCFLLFKVFEVTATECIYQKTKRIDTYSISEPPAFVKNSSTRYKECEAPKGQYGVFICEPVSNYRVKKKCMCTIHHFKGQINVSMCRPKDKGDDRIDHLNCTDCIKYSENGTGPCLNGGTPICDAGDSVASDIRCNCSEGYDGKYCEHENVTESRECYAAENTLQLRECDIADVNEECIYNNEKYQTKYRCGHIIGPVKNVESPKLCRDIQPTSGASGLSGSSGVSCLTVSYPYLLLLLYMAWILKDWNG